MCIRDSPVLAQDEIAGIDSQQNYFGAKLGGKLQFDDLYFKRASASYRYFGDELSSREHHVVFTPTFEFEIVDELITTDFIFDYLKGGFERDLEGSSNSNNFNTLNVGVQPSLLVLRDNLTLNLGAAIFFSNDSQNDDSDFFIYPKVTASYRLLDEKVIAYGGLEGGLKQNTYRDAVQANPYVSPTLRLTNTRTQFDAYVGLKGKVSDVVSYNVRGGYISEKDKALFVNNRPEAIPLEGFDYGNSFSYRYDDLLTLNGYGELNFNVNKKFKLGVSAEVFSYDTDDEQEAWNLPELKVSGLLDYQITDQWFAGAQLFVVGAVSYTHLTLPTILLV